MKRLALSVWVVVLSLGAAFMAVEVYARLRHHHFLDFKAHELTYRNADMVMHHGLIPNAVGESVTDEWRVPYRINSWGLRDREYTVPKPVGTFRILVVGDSGTEGYGVRLEETFVKRFEERLNHLGQTHTPPVNYEVINGGVAGYSPLLEYMFLSRKGLRLEPDLVLLQYNYSDLRDDVELEYRTTFDAQGLPLRCHPLKRARAHGQYPVERFLSRHSRAFLYLEHKLNVFLYNRFYPYYKHPPEVELFVAFRGSAEEIATLWKRNARYLGLIHDLLRERSIPLVLFTWPDAVEVDPSEASEWRKAQAFATGAVLNPPLVISHLTKFAHERKIPFVNLSDDVKTSSRRPLYFRYDPHMNPQGHEVLADALFRCLVDQ